MTQGRLVIDVKNRFETGDHMELVTPTGTVSFDVKEIIDRDGKRTDAAPGSGYVVKIPLPEVANAANINEFALQVRYLPR